MAKKKLKRRGKMPPNIFQAGGDITSGLGINPNSITTLGKGGASGTLGMQSQDLSRFAPKGGGFDMGSIANGGVLGTFADWNQNTTNKFMDSGVGGALEKLGIGSSGIGGIANTASSVVTGLMNPKGYSTGVGNALQTVGSLASNIPGVGGLVGAGVGLVGGLVNSMFGSNLNEDFINQTEGNIKNQEGYVSGASTNAQLMSDWSSLRNIGDVSKSQVGSDGWFSNKAKNKTRELNRRIKAANQRAALSLANTASNIDTQNDFNVLSNFSAYGGPLEFGSGAIGYEFDNRYLNNQEMSAIAKQRLTSLPNSFQALPEMNTYNAFAEGGGIHIKKKNRGKFTEYCGGKVTEECIRRGKNSSNPTTRKRATFAQNARNWNAFGGWLNTQGGDFTNGVTFIDEGGSHEENPYQGIQIGVDPEGAPNLVEQGEVVYDDYVFSDRMEIPDDIRKEYKLRGKTFAKAAKSAQRESEERPNDPLSTRGLQAAMERIAEAQEEVRNRKRIRNIKSNRFDKGGPINPAPIFTNPYLENSELPNEIGGFTAYGTTFGNAPMTKEELNNFEKNRRDYMKSLDNEERGRKRQTWTRYAPIIGSGLASLSDLFSKPDYDSADLISGVDLGAEAAGYAPIGNYLSYRPLDRDFYINKMNQQAAATRRGLMNTSGGNRLNAQAGILAADYNYGQNMGNLARQAEEYNQQLRERVEAFNRGTNMFNTETGLKASMFNAESRNAAKRARLGQATTAAQMRQAIKDQDAARRSANITNFLQGLGDMGWENEQANWLDTLAKSGVLKMNTRGEYTGGTKKAKGGKVRTKKKKGLTYG